MQPNLAYAKRTTSCASLWLRFSLRNWRQATADCGQTFRPAKVARTMWGLDNLYGAATSAGAGAVAATTGKGVGEGFSAVAAPALSHN